MECIAPGLLLGSVAQCLVILIALSRLRLRFPVATAEAKGEVRTTLLLGLPLLLLPVHLVWLELLVHPIAMLLFEAEPAAPDVMKRPPRDPKAGLLPRRSLLRSVATGVLLTVMALAIYAAELPGGEDHARAVALVALVCGDLLLVFVERAVIRGKANVWLPRTATFWVIWIAAGLTIPGALYVAPVAHALRVTALPLRSLRSSQLKKKNARFLIRRPPSDAPY